MYIYICIFDYVIYTYTIDNIVDMYIYIHIDYVQYIHSILYIHTMHTLSYYIYTLL